MNYGFKTFITKLIDIYNEEDFIEKYHDMYCDVKDSTDLIIMNDLFVIKLDGNSNIESDFEYKKIEKKCPHCNNIKIGTMETSYVICGHGNGEKIFGCGKDWCFICGKKLCKEWGKNSLHLLENRNHNSYCCYKYCEKNKKKYSDYCKCNN